jgi:hypothetical protein
LFFLAGSTENKFASGKKNKKLMKTKKVSKNGNFYFSSAI